jgi:hypothetical protein
MEKILNDRLDVLLERGILIESHTHYNYDILLYSLNRDFVEVYYDTTLDKIVWIMAANDYDLQKYLNRIEFKF